MYSAAAWRLCWGNVVCNSKSESLSVVSTERPSGVPELNAIPADPPEAGDEEVKMPVDAAEWRFNIKRDIIVTLMQLANDVKQPSSNGCKKRLLQYVIALIRNHIVVL